MSKRKKVLKLSQKEELLGGFNMKKMKKSKFEKDIVIKDYEICSSFFSKVRGLMFRRKSKPLLFIFDKPTRISIHSFFVRFPFIAVWFLNGKPVDKMLVMPWKFSVNSRKEFDMLLEIPVEFL